MKMPKAAFALVFTFTAGFAGLASAVPIQLASHQAVYELSLNELGKNSPIEAVRGRIVLKVEQQCDGVIVNQRMVLEMINVEGHAIISDYHQSTWEDNSGKVMRFDMSNTLNGETVEKYRGVAEHQADKTIVTFSEPARENMELPKGVIFPAEHTRELLKAAAAGKNLLSAKVFDGNGEDGLSDTLAVIGKGQTLLKPGAILRKLSGRTYWPLQISFFDLSQQQTEPDYEIGMKMFDNGVASDLRLNYQDFSLFGNVSDLKLLTSEKCS